MLRRAHSSALPLLIIDLVDLILLIQVVADLTLGIHCHRVLMEPHGCEWEEALQLYGSSHTQIGHFQSLSAYISNRRVTLSHTYQTLVMHALSNWSLRVEPIRVVAHCPSC